MPKLFTFISHQVNCPSRGCKTAYGKRHNTLLHFIFSSDAQGDSKQEDTLLRMATVTKATIHHESDSDLIWLSIAIIQVLDIDGRAH